MMRSKEKTRTAPPKRSNALGSMRLQAPPDLPPREVILQYERELEEVGKIQSVKSEELVLREHVYCSLWSKVKFVLCDSELDFGGKIARSIMKGVRIDPDFRDEYWARNRQKVLKWINQKRNNTIGAVKREFMRKYHVSCDLI